MEFAGYSPYLDIHKRSLDATKNTEGITSDFLQDAAEHGGKLTNTYYHASENSQVYGIGEAQLSTFAKTDYDKLCSGNYAIVSRYVIGYGENPVVVPNVGNTVTLTDANGEAQVFEVVELVSEYPYNFSAQMYIANSLTVAIADEMFQGFYGSTAPMQTNINVGKENLSEFEDWLNAYTTVAEPNLAFISRNTLKAGFDGLQKTYTALGGGLSAILALIGVLNFINTVAAGILSRRRELAMLQSVGMTGNQLRKTLFCEGAAYTALTAAFTLTIGIGCGWLIMRLIAGQVWFFKESFTVLPSIICLPLLLAVCAAVPIICYAKMTRVSVVERLRVE